MKVHSVRAYTTGSHSVHTNKS